MLARSPRVKALFEFLVKLAEGIPVVGPLLGALRSAYEIYQREVGPHQEAWRALRPALPDRGKFPGPLAPEHLLEALRAPYRLVPFTGRKAQALRDEMVGSIQGMAPSDCRAWILWGEGGIGKTRMAVEVAERLQAMGARKGWAFRFRGGWQAFFVPPFSTLPQASSYLPFWSRPPRPTLLIVDYAEQRPADELRGLARAVREAAKERRHPLALLFLMRAAPAGPAAGHVADALREAGVRYETRRIPSLEDPDERRGLFEQARQQFRQILVPRDAPAPVDYAPEALPSTPLALLALAVLAAYGLRTPQSQDAAAILEDLWERREQLCWRSTLEAQGGREMLQTPDLWAEARDRIERALAAATLGRPFAAPEEVASWWREHFPLQATTADGRRLDPGWRSA
ncbi:hypothetical protein HRbin22_01570 [Candidatus Thermoflexus japonica]|uniref:Uncharacterized protein n=1 Tax=Candidatus Thermoflexus japonica TaxID=2035417 RepID=A0A2H5Y7A4_9CHLR|nr:hypothetical protein HRbin22_01570 [Candidatus Thermoflexus japonica]